MAGFTKLITPVALLVLGACAQQAFAQSPSTSTLSSVAARSVKSSSSVEGPTARWMCAGGLSLDVRPVSYDGPIASKEWVIVYRRDGVAYSAERVDQKTAEAFQATSCGKTKLVG